MEIALTLLATSAGAALVRYCLGFSQGCLFVGKTISATDSGTGYQDAVTPPFMTNITIFAVLLALGSIGYSFWSGGFLIGVLNIAAFLAAALIISAFVPGPEAAFWIRQIYRSLLQRAANYAKTNDHMRSEAALTLAKRIEERFAGTILP